ncbi:SDR family oxidoreductase [Rhizobium sp. TRM95111]|uniref:SDR family NAD(P)-dependent oxidoreductase n=1 Tax=Rhizobium alarense TaxID=2846851 RepID=UPI001F181693|nr:SDR family oxidoreductase [Rhizobium alarense]MCF3639469.1 SDR family oxidoreductase [Rhizobium alarense]
MTKTSKRGTALVTGASSGIGATYADRLAGRGYDLLLVARDAARLSALAERLERERGISAEILPADLAARDDLRRVERRLRDDAAITLLVNNAGIGPRGPLLGEDIDYLDAMIDINVTAVNRLAVAAAQAFAARGTGAIINIASVVAIVPEFFSGTYGASKGFVLALTQGLAPELDGKGVRLQAVLPGLTRTEIFERAGGSIDRLDPNMVMEVTDMVDAALAGFDQGELITIPSLPQKTDWETFDGARMALRPNLSRSRPAERYGVGAPQAA